MKRPVRTAIVFAFASLVCSAAGAKIVTIDIPGAVQVGPTAMNDKGQVTGIYYDKSQGLHGFIWQLHGPVVTFDVPNAQATFPVGISATGVVTGRYYAARVPQGFVRAADGTITTFRAPDGHETYPAAANRDGWSVGLNGSEHTPFQIFLRSPTGETTEFTVPGSNGDQDAVAVNRSRMIAGDAVVTGQGRGFVRSAHGTITMFGDSDTRVTAMNDHGTIVGWTPANGVDTGYVRTSDGTITTFAAPNGAIETVPLAINNAGTIAGQVEAGDQTFHGFIRTPDGTLTPFDIDGAVDTYPVAINNKGAMAGSYKNAAGDIIGFFAKP